jgi:hypothetical protein
MDRGEPRVTVTPSAREGERAVRKHLPDQVPGRLRRFDDPFGITWRVVNAWRRFSVRRSLRFLAGLARNPTYRDPILVVGLPRSGTTLLHHLLRSSSELVSLPHEGHNLWRMFHHPRWSGWDSDRVGAGEVKLLERRMINASLYAWCGTGRLIEKTADNLLRVPYLLELFPDATVVVMKRDPCDVLNSYINGWRHPQGRFRSYYVPERLTIPGREPTRQWCSTLIPGWRELRSSPVPEIALAQLRAYVMALEEARRIVPERRLVEIHLESLLESSDRVYPATLDRLRLRPEVGMRRKLEELLANPVNALSAPRAQKWRAQNPDEVSALLPELEPLARALGYRLDPGSGACTIAGPAE